MEKNNIIPFLTEINKVLVEQTREEIKTDDELLMAKLSILNHYDSEGYDCDEIISKIRECDEQEMVVFSNNLFSDREIQFNSIEDIVNNFKEEMSDINTFLWIYCYYNGYNMDDVYRGNIESGNLDGLFSILETGVKVDVLSNVSSRVNRKFKSIYSESMLNNIWGRLTTDEKNAGIKMEIEY